MYICYPTNSMTTCSPASVLLLINDLFKHKNLFFQCVKYPFKTNFKFTSFNLHNTCFLSPSLRLRRALFLRVNLAGSLRAAELPVTYSCQTRDINEYTFRFFFTMLMFTKSRVFCVCPDFSYSLIKMY